MKAIQVKEIKFSPSRELRMVEAFIVADTAPDVLPVNGADVEGLKATDTFAPFSMIYVVDANAPHKLYIANESGIFVAQ